MYYKIKDFLLSIDIYSVVSKFILLKEARNGYVALCPFHHDKNPSFFLNLFIKRYYCFACHKKGNVLTFVMDYKKLSFYDALNFLSINFSPKYKVKKYLSKSDELINVVSDLYYNNLLKNIESDKNLIQFVKSRGISIDDIDTFKLGFCSGNFNWLASILIGLGYSSKYLSLSGLFVFKNGFFYDRFRYRIIFPIRDIHGNVIAFGGRVLKDEFKPKYINSAETFLFSKKSEFYGIHEAFLFSKCDTIIIVEGYMDVITLHKYKIKNVIAVLGTAFSKEHFKKISSIYKNIIFCYDGDNAGRLATIRTALSCLEYIFHGVCINFVLLPQNFDPDSFIKAGYIDKFLEFLKKPVYILDLVFNRLIFNFGYKDKIEFFSEVLFLVKKIQNLYLKKFIFFFFFRRHFEVESIIFDYARYNDRAQYFSVSAISSLDFKACYFLLKKRELISFVNLNYFLCSYKIDFFSDVNSFFETLIIIRRNRLIESKFINYLILNKIDFINSESLNLIKVNESEFLKLLSEIYKSC